jgi:hypothetical protein
MAMHTNLLTTWYEHTMYTSSPLQIKPFTSREKIEFIYKSFSEHFGLSYFDVIVGQDRSETEIPWIFTFLASKDNIGSIGGLYLAATLCNYLTSLDLDFQKKFKRLKGSPEQMRTFFFELFTYYCLDKNKIPNQKKVLDGIQELEGIFTINKKTFLFECRKAFIPRRDDLDILRRLVSQLNQSVQKITKYLPNGMLWQIKFKKNSQISAGNLINKITKAVDQFIDKLNNWEGIPEIQYHHELEVGSFMASDYTDADYLEITAKTDYDILLTVKPSSEPGRTIANIMANFSVFRSKIYKKLESTIREKKRQHEKSKHRYQVILIDNEEFPEFNMTIPFPMIAFLMRLKLKKYKKK